MKTQLEKQLAFNLKLAVIALTEAKEQGKFSTTLGEEESIEQLIGEFKSVLKIAEPQRMNKFEIGQVVIVTGNGNDSPYTIGDKVTVTQLEENGKYTVNTKWGYWQMNSEDLASEPTTSN